MPLSRRRRRSLIITQSKLNLGKFARFVVLTELCLNL